MRKVNRAFLQSMKGYSISRYDENGESYELHAYSKL